MATMQKDVRTIRVRVIQCNYITRDGISYSGHFELMAGPEGKVINNWIGDELWASPTEVESWTTGTDPRRPLVTIIGNRSIKEVEEDIGDKEKITLQKPHAIPDKGNVIAPALSK